MYQNLRSVLEEYPQSWAISTEREDVGLAASSMSIFARPLYCVAPDAPKSHSLIGHTEISAADIHVTLG